MSVCINYKCYITIELTFLKESMLIRQVNQKSVIFVHVVFLDKGFKFQSYVCNGYHHVLMMSIKLDHKLKN